MDRDWLSKNRMSKEYQDGVDSFVKFAIEHNIDSDSIPCPCVKCGNMANLSVNDVREHLYFNGIDQSYKRWIWHGEDVMNDHFQNNKRERNVDTGDQSEQPDNIYRMFCDAGENFDDKPDDFAKILEEAESPLYDESNTKTLSFVTQLLSLKASHGWSDVSFTKLLKFLKAEFPKGNKVPSSTYEAKKTLKCLGMEYEKIHACPNDCVLYRREFLNLDRCPKCNQSRWKLKKNSMDENFGIPAKVLWYIPPVPRFKRWFKNPEHAKSLVWHDEERIKDGKLRHPADTLAWKNVDEIWPQLKGDARNLRLGLSADGINPHSSLSSNYSCWPVILCVYNLPPWLCMKKNFCLLTLLISGPKQPGNDIDVYLAPLVDDLKLLWNGIDCYDAYKEQQFTLRGVLLWTINDFPAYENLSGHCVKGYKACPLCSENTDSMRLKNCKKVVYMGHRRFLPRNHHYRKYKNAFDGKAEDRIAPQILSGEQVYAKVQNLNVEFGKSREYPSVSNQRKRKVNRRTGLNKKNAEFEEKCWKKKSIFFELEYWKSLLLPHNLDVMHIEKNICDSIIGTLLNIPGKTKDGIAVREDLNEMGLRKELAPVITGQRTYLPAACFNLTKEEKRGICNCLSNISVPEGYSSNIRNLVSMKDLKLLGLKSHDCHSLMQQLLPIAIRNISEKHVRYAITRLCVFFNELCKKVIEVSNLDSLQEEIVIVLCLFEQYFPPSFFDIMIHLTVHLVREVKLGGPVYLRWMYPFERYMKVLKGYVRNRNKPEGSIVEGYIAEEAVAFCSEYIDKAEKVGLPTSRYSNIQGVRSLSGCKVTLMVDQDLKVAHQTVLVNTSVVQQYIE